MAKKSFKEIVNDDKPTLVDFFAEWCGPCKTLFPILEEVKSEMGSAANVIKIDVDKNASASQVYQIRSVPTLIIFKNGKPVWRQSGVLQKKELVKLLKSWA
jgi:thioredoxin 1